VTTPTTTRIEIPRLDGETPRAYAARVEYLTMGPGRSLDKVVQRGQSAGGSRVTQRIATVENWSAKYGWQASAAQYDATLATLAAQESAARYLADLREHGARSRDTARALHGVASILLEQCRRAIRGEVVKTADGRTITIPAMDMTPATFGAAVRGLVAALDLEAHTLGVDKLLGSLTGDGGDDDA